MDNLRFAGIADEAAPDLATQIAVHREAGWMKIEPRGIDGINVAELDDGAFDAARALLEESGMQVVGFASQIANWARPITGPFERDVEDLRRSIPRMRLLGVPYIRIMSYPNDPASPLPEREWRTKVFRRIRELSRIAAGEGIVLLHENCDGWAAAHPRNLSALLGEIDSPGLRVVFDPGNPVSHGGTAEKVWQFYLAAKPWIVHLHVKDCRLDDNRTPVHCYPAEGDCQLERIVRDLIDTTGYAGDFSIEPHMNHQPPPEGGPTDGAGIYREYMNRTIRFFSDIV